MNIKEDIVIGIVGGMGPRAGLALCERIIYHTPASTDQQHLSTILMSFPSHIVDRTAYLEGILPINPAYNIAGIIKKLEQAGAKVGGIACNTSHSPEIYHTILAELHKANSRIKLLNMPSETCGYLRKDHPHVTRVGLMTTNGTYKSGVYMKLLQSMGYEVIIPEPEFQDGIIHRMIYDPVFGLKSNARDISGEVKGLLARAFRFFRERKTEAIILGCTDIPLMLAEEMAKEMAVVDSTESMAKALIREAISLKINEESRIMVR